MKMVGYPIRHTHCDATIALYLGDREEQCIRMQDIRLLDGTTPRSGELMGRCPGCRRPLDQRYLRRDFGTVLTIFNAEDQDRDTTRNADAARPVT